MGPVVFFATPGKIPFPITLNGCKRMVAVTEDAALPGLAIEYGFFRVFLSGQLVGKDDVRNVFACRFLAVQPFGNGHLISLLLSCCMIRCPRGLGSLCLEKNFHENQIVDRVKSIPSDHPKWAMLR